MRKRHRWFSAAVAAAVITGAIALLCHRSPAAVRQTVTFDAAGRRIPTLFDGLSDSPRFEPA